MTVRLRYKISVAISSTSAEENDLGEPKYEVVDDTIGVGGAWKTSVDTGATRAVDLDITSACFLMLRASAKDPTQMMTALTVVLNEGTPMVIEPVGTQREAHFLITSSGIVSLTLANVASGSVPVDVTIAIAGD